MFTRSDETVIWKQVRQAREELLAYMNTFSDVQWNQPSLCDGWAVRDVVAHLILEYHYTLAGSWKEFAGSGFRVNTFMRQTASKLGQEPPRELLAQFRNMVDDRHRPATLPAMNVLVDLLVHEQDIRVPLGQAKAMPLDALRLIFTYWLPEKFNLGEKITGIKSRVKGLKFVIYDLGMTKGHGLEVRGNAQVILMAVTGRPGFATDLRGPGAALLRMRLATYPREDPLLS